MTPALYRLRRADGGWWPIEFMGTTLPDVGTGAGGATGAGAGRVLVVGRYSGDRHLQDQIMELLTARAPVPAIVELIPEFGHWRHPDEHYAVFYDDMGEPASAGSDLAVALHELDHSGHTPWARAAAGRHEVMVDTGQLPAALRAAAAAEHLLACWAVPVDDPLFPEPAVLVVWVREGGPPASAHRYSLDMMARMLTLVLQWRAQVVDLERAARRDPLTGITNRTGFFELLRHPTGRGTGKPLTGVLYIDLDGFKVVNDRLGHRAGDAVLIELADRLGRVVRNGDVVARLGGDEFAVLCPDLTTDHDLVSIAERIIAVAAEPVVVGTDEITVGASVGIATAPTSEVERNPDGLVDLADDALYHAKAAGRGRWHVARPGSSA
jgi:diguanylate cyclase (GGDEF)-like protein